MPHPGPRKREQETWCWDESSKWALETEKAQKESKSFLTFIRPTLIQVLKRAQSHVLSKACR